MRDAQVPTNIIIIWIKVYVKEILQNNHINILYISKFKIKRNKINKNADNKIVLNNIKTKN